MDTYTLKSAAEPFEAVQWLAEHGHRGTVAGGIPGTSAGLLFDRGPGTPVQLAMIGDTLSAHDDGSVTVA